MCKQEHLHLSLTKGFLSLTSKENAQSILMQNFSTLVGKKLEEELPQVPKNSCTLKAQSKTDEMPQSCSRLIARSMQKPQQNVPPNLSTLKAKIVQKEVPQAPMNSSSLVAKVSEKQSQHVPRESPTLEECDIQDQVEQETQNSEENDLSGELGPITQENKRGSTVMQSAHGKKSEKMIFLESAKRWALDGIKNARRKYKNDLYQKHYKAYDNDDLRMENKPIDVSESDFEDLLKYWASKNSRKKRRKVPLS
uniref:Uncharacterized protein n=1 Tax=Solanum lycopersicum TaxID=4081 RepID=K4CZ00_SOLLC